MSDYYLCEHKSQCCGSCLRGIKTEVTKLESQLSQVQGQRDDLVKKNCELDNTNIEVCRQRDSLQTEVRRFEGEWQEAKKEVQRYKEALEDIAEGSQSEFYMADIARQALASQGEESK